MSQPPETGGCPIFDNGGKVLTDSEGRVITRDFHARAPMTYQKNDSRLHDYISTNFKLWQVAASWFLRLAAIVVTTYGALEWVAAPRIRELIAGLNQPLAIAIELQEKRMDLHELELAKTYPLYYTKEEIDHQIVKLEVEINNLRKFHETPHGR